MEPWRYAQEYMGEFNQSQTSVFSTETIRQMFDCDAQPLWAGGQYA